MARIALDAMGGDHAPTQPVLGALDAVERGVDVVLVGDQSVLESELEAAGGSLPIVHAPQVIEMAEDPAAAIRAKKGASVTVASALVAAGDAVGIVSAGSTGAALAAAAFVIGRIPGVSRPAIATIFPFGSPAVVLDVGANLDVKPEHLAQFAIMGSVVAQVYLDIDRPRVGLLNIGEEEAKGRDLEKRAFKLIKELPLDFVGNVEGRDLGSDTVDVVVADGFTGNVLLKTAEATARTVARVVFDALAEAEDPVIHEASKVVLPHLLELQEKFNPEAYGGAHLVGAKGTVVIAHGSSSRVAIANALALASEGAERDLVGRIEAGLGV